jgi:putative ubiquitin-RnfH superfamily antitoxin RatB of RatAB toxin-antitoxin module
MKRCTVAYATPARQWLWEVTLADGATVAEALEQARGLAVGVDVSWTAEVGIFGELCDRGAVPRDGDRIEIYRPLKSDPKESRRARAKARKAAQDREPSRPPK